MSATEERDLRIVPSAPSWAPLGPLLSFTTVGEIQDSAGAIRVDCADVGGLAGRAPEHDPRAVERPVGERAATGCDLDDGPSRLARRAHHIDLARTRAVTVERDLGAIG